jgi:excisionase family DNA binding protein
LKAILAEITERLNRIEEQISRLSEQARSREPNALLSIKEASRVVALSDSHIRRAITKGDLPASNVGTKARPLWRIARSDLHAWLEGRKGGTSGVPPRSMIQDLIDRHLPGLRGRSDSATR